MKKLLVFLFMLTALAGNAATVEPADTLPPLTGNWIDQLIQCKFHINDPRIHYPKFANFCRKVYNWGDHTFNTYDPAYVLPTGKNWKLYTDASAWMQGYGYLFDLTNGKGWENRVILRSNLNYDVGLRLSFMAVSVGYTFNVNELARIHSAPRSTFYFDFSCALFSATLHMQNTSGNTRIERFGQYNGGHKADIPLDGVNTDLLMVGAYYYFNHKRFCQAVVYKFSRYQVRSAGSWMLGASYARQKIDMDFSGLPDDVLAFKPESLPLYNKFHFHDFDIVGGYSYNAVMPHNWVYNVTVLPGVGYKRSLMSGEHRLAEMISVNLNARMGLTYNHKMLFLSLQAKMMGGFVFNSAYSFFNSTSQASLIFGIRF